MAKRKFKVNVGGYVSMYRERTLTVSATDPEEAMNKAVAKFIELSQKKPGDMCDDGTVNWIEPE